MTVLAVAALSARMLAEAATDDGFEVVALDLFGDADTRRASSRWCAIGEPASLRIDEALLLPALGALARRADVAGWIAGSGFEGRTDLLERAAALLPLIGTQADAVKRVREPALFFGFLDSQGIAHPAVRLAAPEDAVGWLHKDAHGCGGWHIRRLGSTPDAAAPEALGGHRYFQREMHGTPMSATFIANGSDASVLGFNRLIVRSSAMRPFVFCGAVGPVPLPRNVAAPVITAVRALAAAFSLRGLGSLDFMLEGETFGVLELNPRPPASMALYRRQHFPAAAHGVLAAHVRACVEGELPQWPAHTANDAVAGTEIVFAARPLWLDERATMRLAARADCHDLPSAAMRFEAGDPLCSVSASGANADDVRALLDRGREAVHQSLETTR